MKKVWAYRRASDKKHYHDGRLQGKYSWGVGGHIDFDPEFVKLSGEAILDSTLKREIEEEVKLENGALGHSRLLGCVNDDNNSVGEVHLGFLYLMETNSTEIRPRDKEIERGSFMTIPELENLIRAHDAREGVEVESWSRIALNPLKQYFSKH
jgi:predicted NUDIX family phosphoesterase